MLIYMMRVGLLQMDMNLCSTTRRKQCRLNIESLVFKFLVFVNFVSINFTF